MSSIWTGICDRMCMHIELGAITENIIYYSWISPSNILYLLVASLHWWMEKVAFESQSQLTGPPLVLQDFKQVPRKMMCNWGRDRMKLNTAVKLVWTKKKKQISNIKAAHCWTARWFKHQYCQDVTGECMCEWNHFAHFLCACRRVVCLCVHTCGWLCI